MKLLVLSDLHVEFAPFTPDRAAVSAADVVVLAGDIHVGEQGLDWAAKSFAGKPIVYVAGNHEFYGGHWDKTLEKLRTRAAELGIHFLENDSVEIGAVRFLGCSLWTDFELSGADQKELAMREALFALSDFRQIKAGPRSHKVTVEDTIERHWQSRAWLDRELANSDGPTIIVTHHFPHHRSVAPKYEGDVMNPAFGSELPLSLLQGAELWIHGHTHASARYVLRGRQRSVDVVCNPRGYPLWGGGFENAAFNPGLVLKVFE